MTPDRARLDRTTAIRAPLPWSCLVLNICCGLTLFGISPKRRKKNQQFHTRRLADAADFPCDDALSLMPLLASEASRMLQNCSTSRSVALGDASQIIEPGNCSIPRADVRIIGSEYLAAMTAEHMPVCRSPQEAQLLRVSLVFSSLPPLYLPLLLWFSEDLSIGILSKGFSALIF